MKEKFSLQQNLDSGADNSVARIGSYNESKLEKSKRSLDNDDKDGDGQQEEKGEEKGKEARKKKTGDYISSLFRYNPEIPAVSRFVLMYEQY